MRGETRMKRERGSDKPLTSAVENVIPDRRDAGQPPAGATGVAWKKSARGAAPSARSCMRDLGDRDGLAPVARRPTGGGGIRPPRTKENWPRWRDDAADGRGETARAGAVDDHFGDGELAGERLALRFPIDRAGEAFDARCRGLEPRMVGDQLGERAADAPAQARSLRPAPEWRRLGRGLAAEARLPERGRIAASGLRPRSPPGSDALPWSGR